jgi:hypothetical protein
MALAWSTKCDSSHRHCWTQCEKPKRRQRLLLELMHISVRHRSHPIWHRPNLLALKGDFLSILSEIERNYLSVNTECLRLPINVCVQVG